LICTKSQRSIFVRLKTILDGEAGAEGVADEEDALGVGHAQPAADDVARQYVAVAFDPVTFVEYSSKPLSEQSLAPAGNLRRRK
jgi:hypothetical protein